MVVQAFYQLHLFSPQGFEFLVVFGTYLVNGFKAVGHKSRTEHKQPFLSFGSQTGEHITRVGLYPGCLPQTRLITNGVLFFWDAQLFGNQTRRIVTLGAVAVSVIDVHPAAATGHLLTMTPTGVGLHQLPNRETMEAEQNVVVGGGIVFTSQFGKGFDHQRMIVKTVHKADLWNDLPFTYQLHYLFIDRPPGSGRILGIHGNYPDLKYFVLPEFFQRRRNGRILVTHGQLHLIVPAKSVV